MSVGCAFPCPIIAKRSPRSARPRPPAPTRTPSRADGLIFLSGQTPVDPDTGSLVEGDIGDADRRCLDNLAIVAAAAGASLDDAVRCGIYVTDIAHVQGGQRGVRRRTSATRPPARTHDRRRRAAARRRGRDRRDPRRPGLTAVTAATHRGARARRCERVARRTPVLSTRTISERAGGTVVLKAENLQRTGSFKVRGASAKLAALGEEGCASGVVAASAGNHAQGARRRRGARAACAARCSSPPTRRSPRPRRRAARARSCTSAASRWTSACRGAGARAARAGSRSCTRSTTRTSSPGQGSLGLELLEDVPDLARVVVPVGGGGLAAGIAIAVKSARPEVEVIGVQVAACAPYPASLRGAASRSPSTRR